MKTLIMDSRFRGNDGPDIGVKIGVKVGILSRNGGESLPLRQDFSHSNSNPIIPYNHRRQITTVYISYHQSSSAPKPRIFSIVVLNWC